MRILFLTNLLPYPLDNGGKIKTYTTIKSFFEAGYEIDLLCFKEKNIQMYNEEQELLKICNTIEQVHLPLTTAENKKYMIFIAAKSLFSKLQFSIYKYKSNEMIEKIKAKISIQYDVIYFDHLPMCRYLDIVCKCWPNARFILDEHNCETIITKRKAQKTRNFIKQGFLFFESLKLEKFEINSIKKMDRTIVLSKEDYNYLYSLTNCEFEHEIIPIGVLDRGVKKNKCGDSLKILFIGTLTWEPNNLGLIWFLSNVLPIIEKEKINYHIYIVGKNPSLDIRKISEKYKNKITVTGYVDSIDEYYDECDCTIVPLFIGSGQRVKLIEAFSKGMPAISTTIGAEGLTYKDNENIIIADDEQKFANAIIAMNDFEFRTRIGENGRKVYENLYSLKAVSNLIVKSVN